MKRLIVTLFLLMIVMNWHLSAQQIYTAGPAINGLSAQYYGDTGGATSTSYYVQAIFPSNERSQIAGPVTVTAPATLTANNVIQVQWSPVPGAIAYDVLKNTTGTVPVGACACAVSVRQSAPTFTDRGASSLTYSVAATPGISLQTATDDATLTLAQMLGDLVVLTGTPTAAAAYTTPTASAIVAALPNCLANKVAGQLYVKNTSAGANTITMTAGSGVTLTGTATVAQNKIAKYLIYPTNCSTAAVTVLTVSSAIAF